MKQLLIILIALFTVLACSDNQDNSSTDSDSTNDTANDTASETGTDISDIAGECGALFGFPSERTGLTAAQCNTNCDCTDGSSYTAPTFSDDDINEIDKWKLITPITELDENPYDFPEKYPLDKNSVCAVIPDTDQEYKYELQNFDSVEAAENDGAIVTHMGACGKCSNLHNLAVYMRQEDMTNVVRQCGIDSFGHDRDFNIQCLMDLGFDLPCAQIWSYNTSNTQTVCMDFCISALNDSYHNSDGTLNNCLQCDEDNSGTIFKSVAGRTRRNSGLPSSICRPCNTIAHLNHKYK